MRCEVRDGTEPGHDGNKVNRAGENRNGIKAEKEQERAMKTLRIALLGFGNSGKALAELLADKQQEIIETYDCKVIVTAIATGSRGIVLNSEGIDLRRAVSDITENGAFSEGTPGLETGQELLGDGGAEQVLARGDFDVLCELTPLNIKTGQPAIGHIRKAFARGAHVVTANKGPIAWAYRELRDTAAERGLRFYYETTVMDGTPVFNLVEHTLKLCRVQEVSGILNSTTNFVLEEMEKGVPYEEIMRSGREKGFIEADPAMDLEGYDAAAKITALLNVLMDADMTPDQVDRKGIEDVTPEQVRALAAEGKSLKLLCRGWRENGRVFARVAPEAVEKTEFLATVHGTTSVVTIQTDLMGRLSIVEEEPEILQTAYGVFSDLLRVITE